MDVCFTDEIDRPSVRWEGNKHTLIYNNELQYNIFKKNPYTYIECIITIVYYFWLNNIYSNMSIKIGYIECIAFFIEFEVWL